jgi:hypothetical protein
MPEKNALSSRSRCSRARQVDGVEVIDVQPDVVKLRRLRVWANEQVQLLATEAQPHDRERERRRGDARRAEQLLVERGGPLEVLRVNAHVVDRDRCHGLNCRRS